MTFGERITQLRKENGYSTRKSFAEKLNIPETTLRNYETNEREAGHTFLKQMSDFFDVSCDYLLCLTDEREKTKSYDLKSSEYSMVEKYRFISTHSSDGATVVDTVLDREYAIAGKLKEQSEKIIGITDALKQTKQNSLPTAAHADDYTNAPEYLKQKEEDIMDDENF